MLELTLENDFTGWYFVHDKYVNQFECGWLQHEEQHNRRLVSV